jgi:hypothetical protein
LFSAEPDALRGVDALRQAGAATLDFAQREEAIIVEGGALLACQGFIFANNAPRDAWLAKKPPYPDGLAYSPAVIAQPDCLVRGHCSACP